MISWLPVRTKSPSLMRLGSQSRLVLQSTALRLGSRLQHPHRRISNINMAPPAALRTLSAKSAAELDEHLMSTGAFSIDQLMELAGLSVSQAVFKLCPLPHTTAAAADHPKTTGKKVLVACGPGNNGGDGLVAARHLHHYGYQPTVYYPKRSKNELYQRLTKQLEDLSIPFADNFGKELDDTDYVVDAVFGFSFSGEVREPFPGVISALVHTKKPILAVDAPSSWNIETGPPNEGPGKGYEPDALISLTAPKPLAKWFKGRHFVGGRFLSEAVANKFGIDVPPYQGIDQIVEIHLE